MTTIQENPRVRQTVEKIRQLAKSYTPEWHFDEEHPDIGTAIGQTYASQTGEILAAMANVTDRYHAEFVNFLDLSLLPAKPARCVCLLSLVGDTIPGAPVAKGTKLVASLMDREDVVFETEHNLYVTRAHITDVFSTSKSDGRPVPLKGRFYADPVIPGQEEPEEEEEDDLDTSRFLKDFTLFGDAKGIGERSVLFLHPSLFDVQGNQYIYVRLDPNSELPAQVKNGAYAFYYYAEEGLMPFEEVEDQGDGCFVLKKSQPCKRLVLDEPDGGEREYSILALRSRGPVREVEAANYVRFASLGEAQPAEYVTTGSQNLDPRNFAPFLDTFTLFSECYIGHETYFSKCGARLKVSFSLFYEETQILVPREEEDTSLKIIKRKPRAAHVDMPVQVYAQEIALEYYNGTGWATMPCDQELARLFASGQAKEVTFTFVVPDDWEPIAVGAQECRYLRLRLLKADQCYQRPGIHFTPQIRDLSLSFSYLESYVDAKRIFRMDGTRRHEITASFLRAGLAGGGRKGEAPVPFPLLIPSHYQEDALYLGMDYRMEEGPVSLFFHLQEDTRFSRLSVRFEYSSGSGFKAMRVVDHTEGFTKSGIVVFVPQPDMQEMELEGKRRYWIRILRLGGSKKERDASGQEKKSSLPRILAIEPNAMQVSNIETIDEREFYVDSPQPNMAFGLSERNILSVDVWVNEMGTLSEEMMQRMETEHPEKVRCSKDAAGRFTSFFVLWTETDSFLGSKDRRVYVLDRQNHWILFGDGIHTDYPKVTANTAMMVRIRRCVGRLGNVPAGSITGTRGNLPFIGDITNPVRAYGGSDIETVPAALRRGADMLHSRGRLISAGDYERAVQGFSDAIEQVRGLVSEDVEKLSCADKELVLVILMKDYAYGSFSFHQLEDPLRAFLGQRCEITMPMDRVAIIEPVFVEISVDIWANVADIDDSFELAPMVQQLLDGFLCPVAGEGHLGWKIGTLPQASQIQMCLGALKSRMMIKKISLSASYTDAEGRHEVDLSELAPAPYMVCKSGIHRVHILYAQEGVVLC